MKLLGGSILRNRVARFRSQSYEPRATDGLDASVRLVRAGRLYGFLSRDSQGVLERKCQERGHGRARASVSVEIRVRKPL